MNENTQVDTQSTVSPSQDTTSELSDVFNAPAPETTTTDSTVDEVIFGIKPPEDLAYQNKEETGTQSGETPQQEQQVQQQQSSDNDQVRYQYWQSEADKRKNDVEQLKQTNEMLQSQVNTLIQNSGAPQQETPKEEQFVFPPPPEKPQKPHTFNREEAYTDPTSESASYLNATEQWRDDMDEYNRLRGEYDREVIKAERQAITDEQNRIKEARVQQVRQQEELGQIHQYVTTKYGVTADVANDFLRTMSTPESLTVDNLWKLYALEKGTGQQQSSVPQQQSQHSAAFEQTQRAQQVPSPMGVVSGVNRQTDRSVEDRIMDELVGDYNKQNPW